MTDAQERRYAISGTLAGVRKLKDRKGRTYLRGTMTFRTRAGDVRQAQAFAFGRAAETSAGAFADGPVRLFGAFRNDAYHVFSPGRPPRPAPRPAGLRQAPVARPPAQASLPNLPPRPPPVPRPPPEEPQAVISHWKSQPCGPGRSQRKVIWVKAYRRYEAAGPARAPGR